MDRFRDALPAFLVGIGGLCLAWLYFAADWVAPVGLVALAVAGGVICYFVGRSRLPQYPAGAVTWLSYWVLVPGAIAAAAAAIIIIIGVKWEPEETWSVESKKFSAAALAAVTTLLTTLYVKGADDADEGWTGAKVKKLFQTTYKDFAPPLSEDARNAVFSEGWHGMTGWGREARKERAKVVEAEVRPR
ncbi:MAG: hypothetical protein WD965_06990 [Actinomycetota bacterium]